MKKNTKLQKIVIVLVILFMAGGLRTGYAYPETESGGSRDALRSDAPIYTGPVEEGDLEELTVEDFELFGDESDMPVEQYRQYKKFLQQPSSGSRVLYKMRIVDRDLALEDFLGVDIPEKLSEARYDGYLNMNPVTVDGRTIHYVYVYHSPLARAEIANTEAERDLSQPLDDN